MSHRRTFFCIAAVPAVALGVATAAPASATPTNANTFLVDLSCSDGRQYTIGVLDPAADQAVGLVVDSTGVLIPTAFQYDVTVVDAQGNVVDSFSTPVDTVRGRSESHHDVMTCTFSQTEAEVAPDGTAVTIVLDGTVRAHQPH